MLDLVRAFIQENDLLQGDGPVLIGVSGGIDSTALLHCLRALGYPLVCAHFNHGLRPSAAGDRDLVRATAARLEVPFVEGSGDVRAHRDEHGLNLEDAGRRMRYRFLFEQARSCGARAVAAAHSADDQAETVLMRVLRGSGSRGLQGMRPETRLPEFDAAIPLTRPMLGAWREDVEIYQSELGFPFAEDESNRDPSFLRNRVRHELLPYLAGFNPNIRETLIRMAGALAIDEAFLEDAASAAWEAAVRRVSDTWIELDADALVSLPPALAARLLRRGSALLRPAVDGPGYEAVIRALQVIGAGRSGGSCDLVGGIRLVREYDRFWLVCGPGELPAGAWPQVGGGEVRIESLPARVRLGGGWQLLLEPGQPGAAPGPAADFQAVLDADSLQFPLLVRGRRRGERIQPHGMDGRSKRLSDAMIDWKIPQRLRDGWPLLVSDGRVAWVPGGRAGSGFAAGPDTQRRVLVRLFRD